MFDLYSCCTSKIINIYNPWLIYYFGFWSTKYDMSGAKKAPMLCAVTADEGGESDMQIMRRFFCQSGFGGYGTNIIPNASAMVCSFFL